MTQAMTPCRHDLTFTKPVLPEHETILTPEACAFVAALAEQFTTRREMLLAKRTQKQQALNAGARLDFLIETRDIRQGDWKVASIPADLQDRRVEITGPAERKMIINALNSGARIFMADLEDSLSPTWEVLMEAQISLRAAVRRTIAYQSPEGKPYKLNEKTAVLIVRPRGWHLNEKHVLLNGIPIVAALFDFGLCLFHNAKELLARGSGPYFYLPKLESHEEAQLWADIFDHAEKVLGLKHGSIKATVLIETITAAFEMEEILYALRDYCVGLNCGRWDYIFSFIKKFHARGDAVLPDRAQLAMTTHFLRSYSLLLIKTCHKRGAFAMGGMSAYIPVKSDPAANEKAIAMVRADKEREAKDGHDGTWVAHPGLVPLAMEVFDAHMKGKNQLDRLREDVQVTAQDLVAIPQGTITQEGMRNNISVAIQYIAAWLNGLGCVPIHNLMEDAATAEIARSQLWQWVHHETSRLEDGNKITLELFRQMMKEELGKLTSSTANPTYNARSYEQAAKLLDALVSAKEFVEFLTLPAYERLP